MKDITAETYSAPIESHARRFKATVETNGYGSLIEIDGKEIPQVRSFDIHVGMGESRIVVDILTAGQVEGFVQAVTMTGKAFLVVMGSVPCKVFIDRDKAEDFRKSNLNSSILEIPFEVAV
jgi:hypothetical protein